MLLSAGASPAQAQDTGSTCNMIGSACDISNLQPAANGGADGPSMSGDAGKPGDPGNPASDFTVNLQAPRTLGANGAVSPFNMNSFGGDGGQGGRGDCGFLCVDSAKGGNGGAGGNGGILNVTLGSAVNGAAVQSGLPNQPATSGVTVQSMGGTGGAAGVASYNGGGVDNGTAGLGGNGQGVTVNIAGTFSSSVGAGANINSQGGTGGRGRDSGEYYSPQGPDGNTGGSGGDVNVTITGSITGTGYGLFAQSAGGNGGGGGSGYSTAGGQGGVGGKGGQAGTVTATLASGAQATATGGGGAAFYAISVGGVGGTGGGGSAAGDAGSGADANWVNVTVDGSVYTSGNGNSYGVLAQSLGGTGGNGGHSGSWFNPQSGSGSSGGDGAAATITGTGAHIEMGTSGSSGDNSAGVLAQSIGGGGGVGPDSSGWFAVGGNGGAGSDGGSASVTLTNGFVSTNGFNSAGVIAQSIGGGGGKGGDACAGGGLNCDGAIVNMSVGGTGGGGGSVKQGADTNAAMLGNSMISTLNKHSPGLQIQSIGGGGGDGGSAYGKAYSLFYGAAISVGGSGGSGGDGGTVNAARTENNGPASSIRTFDSDSYGILGQSIGGGGGNGGASTAKSIAKSDGGYPSQSLAMATGGSGGAAGSASSVYLQSSGLVLTMGGGSAGMVAQSIGGGGGNAGDASATSSATGGDVNLAVSLSFGGKGGTGNNGGNSETMNHGLIITSGESATGMLVQSIGGGGGNGGAGDSKSSTDKDVNQGDGAAEGSPSGNLSFSLGSGGSGGMGGSGANATATNTGAILTLGDSAHGIQAQTIGGGGGNAGGGAASTQGQISIAPQIGGSGGNGGDTWYTGVVTVTNSGTIVTFGADANVILAQSIGGGGGSGGKAGTSSADAKSRGNGGNGKGDALTDGLTAIENDFNAKGGSAIGDYNFLGNATSGAIGTINSLLGNAVSARSLADGSDGVGDDLDSVAESGGKTDDSNNAKSISLNIAVGGKGGNGGSGGTITVTNNNDVATLGKMSDAIIAQSVGGGGGKGGAASTAATQDYSGSLTIGGTGGKGGNGGEPTIINTASVYTMGPLSAALVAQSIGGGGGIGGASVTTAKSASASLGDSDGGDEQGGNDNSVSLQVSLGGNGGAGGISEAAIVNNSGTIETRGHDSIGIIAQSIAGGGGIVKTLATDLDNAGGSATASSSKDYSLPFKFGGSAGAAGNSGAVHVTTSAPITTKGDNSHGILAQSIAGGGGVALGGKPNGGGQSDFFGSGSRSGSVTGSVNANDDGIVNVSVQSAIATSGQGAMGVVAQSIGGGGGLAGDAGWTSQYWGMSGGTHMSGNGGAVDITVAQGASVTTGGQNAPVIWAQSIGGGGGRITNKNGAYIGTAGGSGKGGAITIEVDGTVQATGNYSAAIFAQSSGDATSNAPITITVAPTGSVTVGTPTNPTNNSAGVAAGSAIYIDHGGTGAGGVYNTVTNNGTVYGYAEPSNSIAVYSNGGYTKVVNNGTMGGDILLQNGGGQGCFTNTGTFGSGDAVQVGACGVSNSGTIDVARAGVIGRTAIVGDYTQTASGVLNLDVDLRGNAADNLAITGRATIAGTIHVNPTSISNRAITVLSATDGVTMDAQLQQADNSALFDFPVVASANTLAIQPAARFVDAAAGLGKSKQAVARNLQHLFESGASMDDAFTALSRVQSADVSRSFSTLAGEALGALGAFRYSSSRAFVGNLYGGCDPVGQTRTTNCLWARAYANWTQQDETTNSLGYHADAKAFQMGAVHELSSNWSVSAAVAYEGAKFRNDDRTARVKGDSILLGGSVQYTNGPLEVSGALDAGYGWYDSRRTVTIGSASDVARGSPEEWALGLHSRASYTVDLGTAYVEPSVDLHAIRVHASSFTETGPSPFNLAVESQNDTWLSGSVGLEVGGRIPLGGGAILKPYLGGAIEVSNNNDWQTTARFASQPGGRSFTAFTAVPGTLKRINVGAELLGSKNVDFSIQYSPEFGNNYTAQSAIAHLTYRF